MRGTGACIGNCSCVNCRLARNAAAAIVTAIPPAHRSTERTLTANGTTVEIDDRGNVTVTLARGASLTVRS